LRGCNGDSKKDSIKDELKQKILLIVSKFAVDQEEYPQMVRVCIDFSLDNNETTFLFSMVFPLIKAQQKEKIFVEQILHPILSGKFKDCCIPEEIL